ncbi:MAG: ubiquinone biosynthesis protein [Komarekiella atlantica HA4396-MV6]|nr:ubiquinone biosynthesis protein [Komarekiella atlantica HA4396-MV6]
MQSMNSEYLQPVKGNKSGQMWTSAKNFFRMLKATKAFLTLLIDDSGNLGAVEKLSTGLVDTHAFEVAVEAMKLKPEVAEIIAERYMAPPHDLEALLQYPKDSLGYTYASSMKQSGFQTLAAEVEIDSDTSYVENRWQQTHDIWHIITGFDTSEIGEIGLQAFYLAQFQLPLASMLIANALISITLFQPEVLSPLLGAIAKGWQMGQTAKPLIAQKWEEAWEKPVKVWQLELNVQPIS